MRDLGKQYQKVVVAFSGGMDSTVALFLSLLALGREKVQSCTVDWGQYFPRRARENIDFLVSQFSVRHLYLPGETAIENAVRGGPACNFCTKKAKLGTIRAYFGNETLIIGGSNQSDSWGQRGVQYLHHTFSPLFYLGKSDILRVSREWDIPLRRIGENRIREGCILKHLLKPLASDFHAQAVIQSNNALLEIMYQEKIDTEIANVKIIGPLQKNTALVNLRPSPSPDVHERILGVLRSIPEIDSVHFIDRHVTLVIRANPGQYRNFDSMYWIEKGRLQPDFVAPISVQWMPSTNRKLRTFQVIDCVVK
ncbi:MAG: 7-cyano-7-deazaguanine synthase [Candidatus Atribacteria bacterium]|nr:7-cyano-7-deazaguanine synthase [Candidatus Atribacteria bacterium]